VLRASRRASPVMLAPVRIRPIFLPLSWWRSLMAAARGAAPAPSAMVWAFSA